METDNTGQVAIDQKPVMSSIGMVLGSLALIVALTHFWAGPFAPQPDVESGLTDIVSTLKNVAHNVANDEKPEASKSARTWDVDDIVQVAVAIMGALAVILSVFGFTHKESKRAVIGGLFLGSSAIVFQFFAFIAMAFLGILVLYVILSVFDF